MNYCPNCGHKLKNDFTLCPKCSHRLKVSGGLGFGFGSEIVQCARCKGEGRIDVGSFAVNYKTCPSCGGAGVKRV